MALVRNVNLSFWLVPGISHFPQRCIRGPLYLGTPMFEWNNLIDETLVPCLA